MGDLFDARAFTIGMVALINPCGFALLPAYLGFFLGLDDGDRSTIRAVNRAQIVGLSMSAGFLAVFAVLGLFLGGTLQSLNASGWLPRITVVMGVGLMALGIAMAFGFQINLSSLKISKGGDSRSFGSMFLFGVSYAIASLSCTIGLFLSAVGISAGGASFGQRFGSFLSYGIGMGLLATALTLAVGFGKKGMVNRFRTILPHINRISSVVLVVVGFYVALYGIWAEQVLSIPPDPTPWIDSIVVTVEGWSFSVSGWLDGRVSLFGSTPARTAVLGWGFLVINLVVAGAGLLAKKYESTETEEVGEAVESTTGGR